MARVFGEEAAQQEGLYNLRESLQYIDTLVEHSNTLSQEAMATLRETEALRRELLLKQQVGVTRVRFRGRLVSVCDVATELENRANQALQLTLSSRSRLRDLQAEKLRLLSAQM